MSPAAKIAVLVSIAAVSSAAHALDIVISNDDGFESAYSHALYQKLKAAGHRVMISASAQDQSGQGSATFGMRPMTGLARDTRAGSVKAGAPSFGALPSDPDVHYVDGTPGMSVTYALDKLAPTQWQKQPDLVISGPNFGNNLSGAAVGSGTIAAALFAVNRGIPAIAVSDAHSFRYRGYQVLSEGDIDYEIAEVTVKLVSQLEAQAKKSHQPLLPPGTGLNVNIPAFAAGSGKSIRYQMTRLGRQAMMYYTDDLSQDPNVRAMGINMPSAPGYSWMMKEAPVGLGLPVDKDPRDEIVAIKSGVVTVSVMQGIPQAGLKEEQAVMKQLNGLFKP